MRVLVLAAGFGTRLMPLTEGNPKALVPVNTKPMLDYSLALFQHYNIKEVMINGHYFGEQIESYIRKENARNSNIHLRFQDERKKILGSAGAIAKASSWLYEKEVNALIWNADSLLVPNLLEFMAYHIEATKSGALSSMILAPYPERGPNYMSVQVEGEKVLGFCSSRQGKGESYHFVGGYILHKNAAGLIPAPKEESAILENVWDPLAQKGKLFFWPYKGPHADLGYVDGLREAEVRLRNGEFLLS